MIGMEESKMRRAVVVSLATVATCTGHDLACMSRLLAVDQR